MVTENPFHDPDAADDRRCGGAVSGHLENARLSQDPAANGLSRKRDSTHRNAADPSNAVVFPQTFSLRNAKSDETMVRDGRLRFEKLLHKETGFFYRRELERVVEFIVVLKSARWVALVEACGGRDFTILRQFGFDLHPGHIEK